VAWCRCSFKIEEVVYALFVGTEKEATSGFGQKISFAKNGKITLLTVFQS
jgi:hypothetical protein